MSTIPHSFPLEDGMGTITIEGNKIICKTRYEHGTTEIDMDKLEYAYLYKRHNLIGPTDISLFLFDHAQQWLPVNYRGFGAAYQMLSNRYGFNDELFFKELHDPGGNVKTEIWRKEHEDNFKILPEVDFSDIKDGFKLQDGDPGFITWDLSPRWIIKKQQVHQYTDAFETIKYRFTVPVRIGCIVLNDFEFSIEEDLPDRPVVSYYAQCHLRGKRDETYFQLKEALKNMFGTSFNFYERDDQNYYSIESAGIRFSITYDYDSEHSEESGFTWLNITNLRDYPGFRRNKAYEASISIDAHALLQGRIGISQSYRTNTRVLDRPEIITSRFGSKAVLWRDDKNRDIGFAMGGMILTVPIDDIVAFHLWNNMPAKYGGGSYLSVALKDGNKPEILSGYDALEMDYMVPLLKDVSGCEVIIDPAGMDC